MPTILWDGFPIHIERVSDELFEVMAPPNANNHTSVVSAAYGNLNLGEDYFFYNDLSDNFPPATKTEKKLKGIVFRFT